MISFTPGKTREEKIDKYLDTLCWYFSEKKWPTGAFRAVGEIHKSLQELNGNIVKANQSSDRLTAALNRITLAGVIVAGLALIVTIVELLIKLDFL